MPPVAKRQPPRLERLIERLDGRIQDLTSGLASGDLTVTQWEDRVGREIKVNAAAAYMQGAKKRLLSADEQATVARFVKEQHGYLARFADEIKAADELPGNLLSRAAMYAQSVKEPYWSGSTQEIPLPALPGDGSTECLTNCKCIWSIETLDAERGDYNATWIRNALDSCSTCVSRAGDWSPYRIRGGSPV